MHKQCVPGSFLPAHAREPGNEAKHDDAGHIAGYSLGQQSNTNITSNTDCLKGRKATSIYAKFITNRTSRYTAKLHLVLLSFQPSRSELTLTFSTQILSNAELISFADAQTCRGSGMSVY